MVGREASAGAGVPHGGPQLYRSHMLLPPPYPTRVPIMAAAGRDGEILAPLSQPTPALGILR